VVGAAALELDMATHDLDDVDARQQVLQEAGWDHREYEGTSHLPVTVSKHQD
jgi:hypothetical protein